MKTRAISLLSATVLAATVLVTSSPAGAGDSRCWRATKGEKGFAWRINQARGGRGLGKLSLDPELSKAAKVHTREMADRATLYHTPSDTLRARVTNWVVLGENVGVGGGVTSLHDAFMNSPAHRDNVLHSAYRHVGIGVINRDGQMWVTVLFEGVTDPGTPLRMPRC